MPELKGSQVKYDLSAISKRRDRVWCEIYAIYNWSEEFDQILGDELLERMIETATKALRFKRAYWGVIRETLISFAGRKLNWELCDEIAIVLAGSYKQLKAGNVIHAGVGMTYPDWLPAEIISVQLTNITNSNLFAQIHFRVMGGPLVGQRLRQEVSYRQLVFVLAKRLGVPKEDRPRHRDLTRFWAMCYVEPTGEGYTITHCDALPHQQRRNAELHVERKLFCNYEHELQPYKCPVCPIGYRFCYRSVHQETYVRHKCPDCRKNLFYEPTDDPSRKCLACRGKKYRKPIAILRRVRFR